MAGEIRGTNNAIPKPVRKARKLWSLQDRSVVSVNLLKANLAEDGCEEAQLDVGKRLLADSDSSCDLDAAARCENGRLAVYWFIKASEQGNEEATRFLQECYDSGRGITSQNIMDVKSCISTSRNEKLTFKAARLLYAKLCNGEDFITTIQLQARLESKKYKSKVTFGMDAADDSGLRHRSNHRDNDNGLPNGAVRDEDDPDASFSSTESEHLQGWKEREGGSKLTVDDLLSVAAKFNDGHLPPVPIDPTAGTKHFKDWNLWTPWTLCAVQSSLFAFGTSWISAVLAFYLLLTYFSLWSSYNFLLLKRRFQTFEHWSDVFRSALREDTPWTDVKAKGQFMRRYVRPYLVTSLTCSLLFVCDSYHFLTILVSFTSISSLLLNNGAEPLHGLQLHLYALPSLSIAGLSKIGFSARPLWDH